MFRKLKSAFFPPILAYAYHLPLIQLSAVALAPLRDAGRFERPVINPPVPSPVFTCPHFILTSKRSSRA